MAHLCPRAALTLVYILVKKGACVVMDRTMYIAYWLVPWYINLASHPGSNTGSPIFLHFYNIILLTLSYTSKHFQITIWIFLHFYNNYINLNYHIHPNTFKLPYGLSKWHTHNRIIYMLDHNLFALTWKNNHIKWHTHTIESFTWSQSFFPHMK